MKFQNSFNSFSECWYNGHDINKSISSKFGSDATFWIIEISENWLLVSCCYLEPGHPR